MDGAALASKTVHSVVLETVSLPELQDKDVTRVTGWVLILEVHLTVITIFLIVPRQVTERMAKPDLIPLAVNVADAAPAAIETDDGTASTVGLLLTIVAGVAMGVTVDKLTVQTLLPPTASAVGLQLRVEKVSGAESVRLTVVDAVPFKVAVITAVPAAVNLPAVAVKMADKLPAATDTDAGTAREVLLLDSATTAPPLSAA